MAWTEQAWRYSLAGIPDPSQSLDEQQTHLSLVNTANASDLAFLGPQAWDYDETLTLTITPMPDTGFDVTTRYAIANTPAVGLTDSIDRDGDLVPTLGSFVVDFDGTVDNSTASRDGDLLTTLETFSAALSGTFEFRHYFDISYSVTPTWVVTEQPAAFGDVDATLSGFAVSYVGTFQDVDDVQGYISTAISGFTPDFDGTFTPAPGRDGDIGLDIEQFSFIATGSSVPPGSTTGTLPVVLGGFEAELTGLFTTWNTDGAFNLGPDGFNVHIEGQSILSGSITGELRPVIGDFGLIVSGTTVLPDLDKAVMRVETPDSAKMRVDTGATAKMKL